MSSEQLEQFIRDNREEFDNEEPAKKVWEKIQQQLEPGQHQETPVVRMNFMRRVAAAAVIILAAAVSIWYFARPGNTQNPVAGLPKPAGTQQKSSSKSTDSPSTQQVVPDNTAQTTPAQNDEAVTADEYNEEMYHYARLAEIKHNQLKKIEKDDPLLYRQFSGEIKKLDSVYQDLKQQLPVTPNKELLLEAMVQNLKFQIELLNQQLDIIHKINQAKKADHETSYKTI